MVFHRLSRIGARVYIVLFLSLLAAAGLYFRLIYLQSISLHVDEFISLLAARGILQHGVPLLPSGTLYEQGLLFSYLEALVLRFFGFSALVGRVPSLILSVATIPLLYYVGKRLFSPPVGLVAATLGAVSAQSIAWGARVRMYALLQLLVLLSVWFLWRGAVQQNDARYRWLSILCYLGALFTHPVSVLLFPPLLLSLLLQRGVRSLLRPAFILELVVPVGGILTTFLLKMVGQPGQLEALAQARPYLEPSLDAIAGFRPLAPFFLTGERLPLTLLAIVGLLILIMAVILNLRGRTSTPMLQRDLKTLLFHYTIFGATILEMVFLVGSTWRDVRYIFMLAPLFFLMASWTVVFVVSWISERLEQRGPASIWARSNTEPISWSLASLLVAGAFLLFLPGARATISKQEWGYDLAFEYLQEHWREGDTVLTIVPFACDLYLPQCDYYASGRAYEEYVFESEGNLVDRWVGTPLLDSASQFDSVLRDSFRAWFVVDGWRLAARYDLDFIRTVAEQMDVVHEVQGVRVLMAEGYGSLPGPEISGSLQVNFADQIELVGYELSNDVLDPGSDLSATLYWKALRPIDQEYSVFVHLRGQSGSVAAQDDSPPLENLFPTNYWAQGETVPDPRILSIPADLSPGRYHLEVGLYLPQDHQRLAILDEGGSSSGDAAILDYVRVDEGLEGLVPRYTMGTNLGEKMALMGHDGVPDVVEPGQDIHLTLYWQALTGIAEDYTVFIHLLDEEGQIIAQHDSQPLLGFYPTSFWEQDEVVRDEYDIHVDSSTAPGEYELVAGMYLLSTGDRLPILDEGSQIMGDLIPLGRVVLTER
jgi:hypothetical protein